MGEHSQEDRAKDPVDVDNIMLGIGDRVEAVRVGNMHGSCCFVIAAEHDKMAGRFAAQIVVNAFDPMFPHGLVKIGGTETGDDRNIFSEIPADQAAGQVFEVDLAAHLQKLQIAASGFLQAGIVSFDRGLSDELSTQVSIMGMKPGGVKKMEVVGEDGG